MDSLGKRLKYLRKKQSLTQKDFAERLGVTRGHISNVEQGLSSPSEQLIRHICIQYGVNSKWLKEGVGEVYENNEDIQVSVDALERVGRQMGISLEDHLISSGGVLLTVNQQEAIKARLGTGGAKKGVEMAYLDLQLLEQTISTFLKNLEVFEKKFNLGIFGFGMGDAHEHSRKMALFGVYANLVMLKGTIEALLEKIDPRKTAGPDGGKDNP